MHLHLELPLLELLEILLKQLLCLFVSWTLGLKYFNFNLLLFFVSIELGLAHAVASLKEARVAWAIED